MYIASAEENMNSVVCLNRKLLLLYEKFKTENNQEPLWQMHEIFKDAAIIRDEINKILINTLSPIWILQS